jgi:hypothetical protein
VKMLWRLVCTCALLTASFAVSSQPPCPVPGDFAFSPVAPTAQDSVRLLLQAPEAEFLDATWTQVGQQLQVNVTISDEGGIGPTPPGGLIATFGVLPAGTYDVAVTSTSNGESCPPVDLRLQVVGVQPAAPVPAYTLLSLSAIVALVLWVGLLAGRRS